ncbi:MAG: TetR/AcrR family transcriptional regulator [Chloroflexaceae bacterium]|nr:TetR/AcrR family transcriptional regulator [Chloroflexaceae bacterium]
MNLKSPERTQQLLEAAATCFARRGFHPTTMDEIAREAGVSAGLIYRHFASKEDLIAALVEQYYQAEQAYVAELGRQSSLTAALDQFLSPATGELSPRTEGLLSAEIVAEALRNPRIEALVRAGDDAVFEALVVLFADAQARGEAPPALAPALAAELVLMLREGLRLRAAFASPEEQDELESQHSHVQRAYRRMLGMSESLS